MHVIKVETNKQLQDAFHIRTNVFVKEQHVPLEEEIDEFEDVSTHFVVYDNQNVVGAGRLRYVDDYGKIERICIAKAARGLGVGRMLMEAIEMEAKRCGALKAKLYAQSHAEKFYEKLGYFTVSDEFLDAGIPHVTMEKEL
ncbi:GNAT family N-acetyltransferase [Bacillus solitudinis]|uniref:GNAT family N-acetyltransferase n=1 Tax=Bacillus solitudinis TaxID=2014074 RepID=UPI000C23614F|nr:GNAT family N-acetyltransferase [Bacillus solitudinis]